MEKNMFQRTELLIGPESVTKLKNSKIIIFGVGGVGGFAAEALARVGIGHLTLVDYDKIDITNKNRQIIALNSTIGCLKVDSLSDRIVDVSENCKVMSIAKKLVKENIKEFELDSYDYVIDAIDTITSKLELAKYCYENNINIISSMGAGSKIDPTRFRVSDINKTSVCPLAKVIRTNLRKMGIKKLKVVWSDEQPSGKILRDDVLGKSSPGSISFVPSVAGLILAGEVVKDLTVKEREKWTKSE